MQLKFSRRLKFPQRSESGEDQRVKKRQSLDCKAKSQRGTNVPFLKKGPTDKKEVVNFPNNLWCSHSAGFVLFSDITIVVEPAVVDVALSGAVIEEQQEEMRPKKVSVSCIDKNVHVHVCIRSSGSTVICFFHTKIFSSGTKMPKLFHKKLSLTKN